MNTKNYLKLVEWSDSKNCFIGSCPGLTPEKVEAIDEVEAYRLLCQLVEKALKTAKEPPKPTLLKNYSGQFVLRLDPDLHKRLHIRALAADMSLNSFCQKLLNNFSDVKFSN